MRLKQVLRTLCLISIICATSIARGTLPPLTGEEAANENAKQMNQQPHLPQRDGEEAIIETTDVGNTNLVDQTTTLAEKPAHLIADEKEIQEILRSSTDTEQVIKAIADYSVTLNARATQQTSATCNTFPPQQNPADAAYHELVSAVRHRKEVEEFEQPDTSSVNAPAASSATNEGTPDTFNISESSSLTDEERATIKEMVQDSTVLLNELKQFTQSSHNSAADPSPPEDDYVVLNKPFAVVHPHQENMQRPGSPGYAEISLTQSIPLIQSPYHLLSENDLMRFLFSGPPFPKEPTLPTLEYLACCRATIAALHHNPGVSPFGAFLLTAADKALRAGPQKTPTEYFISLMNLLRTFRAVALMTHSGDTIDTVAPVPISHDLLHALLEYTKTPAFFTGLCAAHFWIEPIDFEKIFYAFFATDPESEPQLQRHVPAPQSPLKERGPQFLSETLFHFLQASAVNQKEVGKDALLSPEAIGTVFTHLVSIKNSEKFMGNLVKKIFQDDVMQTKDYTLLFNAVPLLLWSLENRALDKSPFTLYKRALLELLRNRSKHEAWYKKKRQEKNPATLEEATYILLKKFFSDIIKTYHGVALEDFLPIIPQDMVEIMTTPLQEMVGKVPSVASSAPLPQLTDQPTSLELTTPTNTTTINQSQLQTQNITAQLILKEWVDGNFSVMTPELAAQKLYASLHQDKPWLFPYRPDYKAASLRDIQVFLVLQFLKDTEKNPNIDFSHIWANALQWIAEWKATSQQAVDIILASLRLWLQDLPSRMGDKTVEYQAQKIHLIGKTLIQKTLESMNPSYTDDNRFQRFNACLKELFKLRAMLSEEKPALKLPPPIPEKEGLPAKIRSTISHEQSVIALAIAREAFQSNSFDPLIYAISTFKKTLFDCLYERRKSILFTKSLASLPISIIDFLLFLYAPSPAALPQFMPTVASWTTICMAQITLPVPQIVDILYEPLLHKGKEGMFAYPMSNLFFTPTTLLTEPPAMLPHYVRQLIWKHLANEFFETSSQPIEVWRRIVQWLHLWYPDFSTLLTQITQAIESGPPQKEELALPVPESSPLGMSSLITKNRSDSMFSIDTSADKRHEQLLHTERFKNLYGALVHYIRSTTSTDPANPLLRGFLPELRSNDWDRLSSFMKNMLTLHTQKHLSFVDVFALTTSAVTRIGQNRILKRNDTRGEKIAEQNGLRYVVDAFAVEEKPEDHWLPHLFQKALEEDIHDATLNHSPNNFAFKIFDFFTLHAVLVPDRLVRAFMENFLKLVINTNNTPRAYAVYARFIGALNPISSRAPHVMQMCQGCLVPAAIETQDIFLKKTSQNHWLGNLVPSAIQTQDDLSEKTSQNHWLYKLFQSALQEDVKEGSQNKLAYGIFQFFLPLKAPSTLPKIMEVTHSPAQKSPKKAEIKKDLVYLLTKGFAAFANGETPIIKTYAVCANFIKDLILHRPLDEIKLIFTRLNGLALTNILPPLFKQEEYLDHFEKHEMWGIWKIAIGNAPQIAPLISPDVTSWAQKREPMETQQSEAEPSQKTFDDFVKVLQSALTDEEKDKAHRKEGEKALAATLFVSTLPPTIHPEQELQDISPSGATGDLSLMPKIFPKQESLEMEEIREVDGHSPTPTSATLLTSQPEKSTEDLT